ncbi:YbaB/EbfC family nucleoid-associated protein [Haloglycomyces albus]|uniref:YbaB/EbfC family nucleoid-associated protein n=1 Tax=Haloglycomyces albus TaxID=526067 RepID=UPI00046CEEB1|nr:YbaB/EbfC family nucleoid-associated protein [Haloglycomyces albus]
MDNSPGGRRNPEEVFARLEELQQKTEADLRRIQDVEAEMGNTETTAVSENGMVTVTLNAQGRVHNIELRDDSMRLKGNLPPLILSTIHEAQATYSLKMAEMAQQALPGIDVVGQVSQYMGSDIRDRAGENLRDHN